MVDVEEHTLVKTYMRYSKRIVVFGIIQWSVIAGTCLLIAVFPSIPMTTSLAEVLKHAMTCASTIAVTLSSGYFLHSGWEESLKKKMESALQPIADTNSNG